MTLSGDLWKLAEHFMDVVHTETGFPVVIFGDDGAILRATDQARVGNRHAGARKVMQGLIEAYAVTAEEAARDPLVREGYICPVVIDGRRVAAFGITGCLERTKPLARVASRLLDAWIDDTRHQAQLRRSEQKYRSLFDHSVQGIFQSTAEGRLLTANTALAEMYGYPSADSLLAAITDTGHQLYVQPEDRQRLLRQLRENGRSVGFQTQLKRLDGRIIDVSINARMVTDPQAGAGLVEGFVEDITARKQAEDALKVSEEKYAKAFNRSPVWVVLSALDTGRYIEVNKTFLRAMGYTREAVVGRTSQEIASWVDPLVRQGILATLEKEGVVREVEVRRRTADGRVLTMLFSAEVIDIAGESCMLSVSQDISARKKAEERLRLNENNLRITLDSIGDAVITTDTAGAVTRMNPMAENLTGWSAGEALGRPLPEVFHIVNAYSRQRVENPAAKVLARGELVGLANHTVLLARDGREYQIADSGAPIRGDDGRIMGVVLVFRDVSEAYARERKIHEHEALLKHITTNIPGVVYQFHATPDHHYSMRYLSQKAQEIFDLDVPIERYFEALIGRIPTEEHDGLLTSIRQAVETASPWHYEYRFIKTSGEIRWFSGKAVPHREGDDVVFDGVLMDITDLKAAQEEVLQRRQFLESVLYHAPDAIITMDAAHKVIDWNPGAVRMFGFTPEEAFGRPLDDLVAGERARRDAAEKTRQVLSGARVQAFETVRYRKDGSPIHVVGAGSPIMVDGALKGVVAVYTDITKQKAIESERKNYEARIQQMQKMEAIGMLAGGIAHDFNNILSAVIGYAELALIDTAEDPRLHQNIRQIHAAGMRARDLVKQILTFSRQDEKTLKPLHLGVQIKEALKMLRSSLPATIEMISHIDAAVDNVMADPTHVHQIVMNLCTNAAQAMEEEGGRLSVDLHQTGLSSEDVRLHPGLAPGAYARIRIQDTGTGIPDDILDRIYDPYFTTKEKGKGTGLGLAVVHGIVKRYEGDISVDTAPGRGTTFDVYLPTIKAPVETKAAAASLPQGTETILLVDDESFIVDFGRQGLARLGYRVEGCTSGTEALERFRSTPDRYDLVITDMTMPRMTGDQLAAEILKLRPAIPIILCTGYSSRLDRLEAETMGIRVLLMKPISLEDLANHVRRVLDPP